MIEVKVLCPCGTKFKFDTEPVNNLVPVPVTCPACGQDVTDLANAELHQKLPTSMPATAEKPRLRISAHPPSVSAPSIAAPAVNPSPEPAPIPAGPTRTISPAVAKHFEPVGDRSIWIGVGGALIASFVGMMIWFLLIKWTHYEIGWIAWGVGVLTGVGARVAGARPSATLGAFTAGCACIAIIGGQFLAARSIVDSFLKESTKSAYQARLTYAKEGVNAKTDDEIRAFLTRHGDDEDEGGPGKPKTIDPSRIQEFREKEQVELQAFVNGKPSEQEFARQLRAVRDTWQFQIFLFKESFSLMTLLWLFLGMGSAFKLASGASGD